jgi:superfamily I DNA/RNA helicase
VTSWLVPRQWLTAEQRRVVELSPDRHRVVAGTPGSGKTQVLLHRAVWLRDRFRVAGDNLRVFVFTNVLKNYIASALPLLGLPPSCVSTFDRWCCDTYRRVMRRPLPCVVEDNETRPDFRAIRQAVLLWACSLRAKDKPFHYIMVDEGQDLDAACFGILAAVSHHVTVGIDFRQQIYDRVVTEDEILALLGLLHEEVAFLTSFRCCPWVARLAGRFLDDPLERSAWLVELRAGPGEKELPLLFVAGSPEEEAERLVEILRARVLRHEQVVVLLPRRHLVAAWAEFLARRRVEIEVYPNIDFTSSRPKLIAYHSAKGLTADTVLMPSLTAEAFDKFEPALQQRLLYVGITRARRWAYLSTVRNGTGLFPPLTRLLDPAVAEICAFQRGAIGGESGHEPEITAEDIDELLSEDSSNDPLSLL